MNEPVLGAIRSATPVISSGTSSAPSTERQHVGETLTRDREAKAHATERLELVADEQHREDREADVAPDHTGAGVVAADVEAVQHRARGDRAEQRRERYQSPASDTARSRSPARSAGAHHPKRRLASRESASPHDAGTPPRSTRSRRRRRTPGAADAGRTGSCSLRSARRGHASGLGVRLPVGVA